MKTHRETVQFTLHHPIGLAAAPGGSDRDARFGQVWIRGRHAIAADQVLVCATKLGPVPLPPCSMPRAAADEAPAEFEIDIDRAEVAIGEIPGPCHPDERSTMAIPDVAMPDIATVLSRAAIRSTEGCRVVRLSVGTLRRLLDAVGESAFGPLDLVVPPNPYPSVIWRCGTCCGVLATCDRDQSLDDLRTAIVEDVTAVLDSLSAPDPKAPAKPEDEDEVASEEQPGRAFDANGAVDQGAFRVGDYQIHVYATERRGLPWMWSVRGPDGFAASAGAASPTKAIQQAIGFVVDDESHRDGHGPRGGAPC